MRGFAWNGSRQVIEQWREAVGAVHGVESKYKRLVKAIAIDIESESLRAGARAVGISAWNEYPGIFQIDVVTQKG